MPASTTDPSEWERLFKLAGFSGCIGSSDGTHIGMLNCHSWATINHKGPKLNIPSRTYNTTVTHTRQILGTTFGHPATWNDKTIVLYDELLKGVKMELSLRIVSLYYLNMTVLGILLRCVIKESGSWLIMGICLGQIPFHH